MWAEDFDDNNGDGQGSDGGEGWADFDDGGFGETAETSKQDATKDDKQ